MTFLTAADMADFRALALSAMVTPCAIIRKTQVDDSSAGFVNTWSVVSASGLTCRVSANKRVGQEVVSEQRIEARQQWLIRLPAGTDVTPKDKIVAFFNAGFTLDSHGKASSGTTYEVDTVGNTTYQAENTAYCWSIT